MRARLLRHAAASAARYSSLQVEVQSAAWMPGPTPKPLVSALLSRWIAGASYTRGASVAFTLTGTAVVTIRNVIFDGSAGGGGAVQIQGGKVVFEDCTFQNFTASPGQAIQFAPTVPGSQLTVTDSVFTNNVTTFMGAGIVIQPAGGGTTGVVIERTEVTGNTYGIAASGSGGIVQVEIRYSTIANNTSDGILAYTTSSVASIVVEHSASVQNGGNGVTATGASAYVSLNDSTVAWNATGLGAGGGGTILSYRNNVIAGNPHPGVTPVSVSQQ